MPAYLAALCVNDVVNWGITPWLRGWVCVWVDFQQVWWAAPHTLLVSCLRASEPVGEPGGCCVLLLAPEPRINYLFTLMELETGKLRGERVRQREREGECKGGMKMKKDTRGKSRWEGETWAEKQTYSMKERDCKTAGLFMKSKTTSLPAEGLEK